MADLTLELRGITKRFPGVVANDHIDFQLRRGEIHALLGENGAGKSTLMNILYGLYQPDEGEIVLGGKVVKFSSPHDAISAGIGMIHQHFKLVPPFTVAENIMLGNESLRGPFLLNRAAAEQRINDISKQYGLFVNPKARVSNLSVGIQQRVEILKAFYRNAEVLILDEPTAVLTPQEANDLFVIMRGLAAQGKSLIFITHKLKEVLAISDTITVLRRGKVAGQADPRTATEAELASMMVGRSVILNIEKAPAHPGAVVLAIQGMKVRRDKGVSAAADILFAVNEIDLEVHAGEIVGVAGVEGNGQTELAEALTGLRPIEGGSVTIGGVSIVGKSPRFITVHGVAHVPEDRQKYGLVLSYPIADNLVLATYFEPPFARGINIVEQAIRDNATRLVKEFDIRTPSIYSPARNLSGGNQQKVVVARELSRDNQLLIAAQPTRGLDVGSIEFIHRTIVQERDKGTAVLLVSAELDEILSLADRIAVMYKGKVVAIVPRAEATREYLGLLMAGGAGEAEYHC